MKAKILTISAKCSDLCYASIQDAAGNQLGEDHDGYVPGWMPGDHYGGYVMLDIDLETGKIVDWKKPTEAQLNETFKIK
jgi:hypothetical protein